MIHMKKRNTTKKDEILRKDALVVENDPLVTNAIQKLAYEITRNNNEKSK